MNVRLAAPVGFVGGCEPAPTFERVARGLGIELIVFTPCRPGPLGEIGPLGAIGATSTAAGTLDDFVARSGVITLGYGCDHQTYCALMDAAARKLRPNSSTVHLARDPLAARSVFQDWGFEVAEFEEIDSGDTEAVERFGRRHGWPVRLRAARWGPTGPAVHVVRPYSVLDQAWADSNGQRWLLEAYEPLAAGLAVVIARRPSGQQVVYPVLANAEHDCRPGAQAPFAASLEEHAISTANSIVDRLDATGIIIVRFSCGQDGRLLVDDIADGPDVSLEDSGAPDDSLVAVHLRAILDWPLDLATAPQQNAARLPRPSQRAWNSRT